MSPRGSTLLGCTLVLCSCLAIQGSAALSSGLFDVLSPASVAGWRQLIGAIVLIVIIRPRLRGRERREWVLILLLGAAMASMNVAFYAAVDLLPLGVAATLLYLGPFAVAALGLRNARHIVLPLLALAGVVMISRPTAVETGAGLFLGVLSGAALAVYTLSSRRLGQKGGVDTLALAVGSSALLLVPFSLPTAGQAEAEHWWVLLASGVVGVAAAFWCDFSALRLLGSQNVSVLFALDPVVGAVAGAVILHQGLDVLTALGIVLIVLTGAITVRTVGTPASEIRPARPRIPLGGRSGVP